MSELSIGAWNARNAFGDERVGDAIEVVKKLDLDVLYLGEMALIGEAASDEVAEATSRLEEDLGYIYHTSTPYAVSPEIRNEHIMSIWSRVGSMQTVNSQAFGTRFGTKLSLPDIDTVIYGLHLDDANEARRLESAKSVIDDLAISDSESIVMGDLNSMNRRDPKSILPRSLGRAIGKYELEDYYDESRKLQRLAGKVLRVCRMADGKTIQTFLDNGFTEVDANYTPTIGSKPLAFQIDHILATDGIKVTDFVKHDQSFGSYGPVLSDHEPISATICRY